MEILELFGWIALGFVPSYLGLEVGYRTLARRITAKLLLTLGGEE